MPAGVAGEWVSVEVSGVGFAEADARIRLTLGRDEIRFRADCNILSGTPTWADGQLSVVQIGSTEMGCSPARHRRDAWMASFFGEADDLELAGDVLVVRRRDDVVRFVRAAEVPPSTGGAPDDSVSSGPTGSPD